MFLNCVVFFVIEGIYCICIYICIMYKGIVVEDIEINCIVFGDDFYMIRNFKIYLVLY